MAHRRVVITGVGLVSPLGTGTEKSWDGLIHGHSGISRITHFDPEGYPCQIAGEVTDFNIDDYIEAKEQKKMDRFIHFALAASEMAMNDSGLTVSDELAERFGVIVGSGMGGLPAIEKYARTLNEKGPRRVTPFFIPMTIINLAPGQISIKYNAKGPNYSIVSACASGTHSIGEAYRLIQRNDTDFMIAGGAEATITPLAIGGFSAMKALSTRNDEPEKASRPFDKDRDGFVMGEGAGIMVLEELEHARKRGAKIYAEITGYGLTSDAYHISSPAPEGEGAARCMNAALKDAAAGIDEINYINAHGTSTGYGDELETAAIKNVFGEHAYKLCVSSTKSMTGHLLGAAGGLEGVACAMSIYNGIVPPTINLDNPDSECDLDYVANTAREIEIGSAISNSFGFGGTNASIIFKKYS